MTLESLVIIGAGGSGREVHDVVEAINDVEQRYRFLGFLADGRADEDLIEQRGAQFLGPVSRLADVRPDRYAIAIGDGASRRTIDEYASHLGCEAATLVHPRAIVGRHGVSLGAGTIVCAGTIVTTNVRTGRHTHVNVGTTISHDVTLGDYVTLSPGVHLAGHVTVGSECLLGIGASVIPGKTVGAGATVGAQAAVVTDVADGTTVVGVPARPR
jgi:sugar O-acyltransferase (sialic acid O-acetyltransferase NeuD family)